MKSSFSKQLSISLFMTDSSSALLSLFLNTFLRTGLLKFVMLALVVSLPPPPQLRDLLEVWWWQTLCAIHDTSVQSNPAGLKSYSYVYTSQGQLSCMEMTWIPTDCSNKTHFSKFYLVLAQEPVVFCRVLRRKLGSSAGGDSLRFFVDFLRPMQYIKKWD